MAIVEARPIVARDIVLKLAEAVGVDPGMAHRIIIDAQYDNALFVYVEMYGSQQVLDLDWAEGLKGAQVKVLDK